MKLEICTQSSQLAAAMATQIGATPVNVWKLVKLRPTAEPKVSSSSEIAEASTMPPMIGRPVDVGMMFLSAAGRGGRGDDDVGVDGHVSGPRSTQAEEGQDGQDDHDEADEIDDAVHLGKLRDAVLMSHKVAMPHFGCVARTILVQLRCGTATTRSKLLGRPRAVR